MCKAESPPLKIAASRTEMSIQEEVLELLGRFGVRQLPLALASSIANLSEPLEANGTQPLLTRFSTYCAV
jgi:hypothetical protein